MVMRTTTTVLAMILALPAAARSYHHYPRDPEVPREFQREHPCPSTGRAAGGCPGYVRDHVIPLCKGGADATWNMQWQTVEAGHAKDRWECRR